MDEHYRDPRQPLETRVSSLLGALTLEEKLSLCAGQNFWETREIPRLGVKPFRMTDGPLSMPWLEQVPEVLETWYPGMEGGTAIARALFGDINPSGKLPVTFPRELGDSPAHASSRTYPGDRKTVHYDEELLVGYRHFDRRNIEPLFPFGHGLSFTCFEYGELQLSGDCLEPEDTLSVSMTLTNTGERAGAEVVQIYLADHQGGDDRPAQALKGFHEIHLEPGKSAELTLELPVAALAVFCPESGNWQVNPACYTLRLGSSSRDIRGQCDFLLQTPVTPQEKAVS